MPKPTEADDSQPGWFNLSDAARAFMKRETERTKRERDEYERRQQGQYSVGPNLQAAKGGAR